MTEEKREITITIHNVTVDKRTNGDGYEYSGILDCLRRMAETMMEVCSVKLIPDYDSVTVTDKVIE